MKQVKEIERQMINFFMNKIPKIGIFRSQIICIKVFFKIYIYKTKICYE